MKKQKPLFIQRRKRKATSFHHALITVTAVILCVYFGIIHWRSEPQIPLVLACLCAGLMAFFLGYSWDEILQGMIDGIIDSLEAILILLVIGMLVGSWIASGTVPTMICYGLKIVTAGTFLPAAMITCLLISFAIGSWGTVGTIGLAFMGMGLSLGLSAPVVAGAVISGAYLGEVISPLSDATNLAAAVAGEDVFLIVRKAIVPALTAGCICVVLYAFTGLLLGKGEAQIVGSEIEPILNSLYSRFQITPATLIPLVLIIGFILMKIPAIPAMLFSALIGMIEAVFLQHMSMETVLSSAWSGYTGVSGNKMIDALLSAGGMKGMLDAVSVILFAMAFGGIMKKTGQMDALVRPLLESIHSNGILKAITVLTCVVMNTILPDQYLAISMPGQMYSDAYDQRGITRADLGTVLLGGGAVTSPLVPWNTCGIYCMTILSVSPLSYIRYAYLGLLLPFTVICMGFLPSQKKTADQIMLKEKQ